MRDPVPCDNVGTLAAYEAGRHDAFIEAADMLKLRNAEILLAVGEMTLKELRAVNAVLAWREREIRSKASE